MMLSLYVYVLSILLCGQLHLIVGTIVRNTTTFNNIEFAGRGYDVLFGNPLSTAGIDPGYRLPIFNLSVNGGTIQTSSDQQYLLPVGVHAYESVSCRLDWQTSVFSTMSSYMSNLQSSAKVSGNYNGGLMKGSFSASSDYKNVRNSLSQGVSAFALSSASCSVYTVDILRSQPPPLHAYFVSEVQRVMKTGSYDKSVFMSLISQFGTHYPTSTAMGARFGQQSEMKSSILNEQSLSSIRVSAELSVSTAVGGATAYGMYSEEVQRADSFSSNCTSQAIFTSGSAPPADGSALTWAAEAFDTPAPLVSSGYQPITTLFTTSNIPGTQQGDLDKLANEINSYVSNTYCSEFGSECVEVSVKDDRCFGGWFTTSEQLYNGYAQVNPFIGRQGCPKGFSAVGGGGGWVCLNIDRTQCYVNKQSVSSFGGMWSNTGGCNLVNPWNQLMACTDGFVPIIALRHFPQSDSSCDIIVCLPGPARIGDTVAPAIIGGFYRLPRSPASWYSSFNMWPSDVLPRLAQCPLGYKAFEWAEITQDKQLDGKWYICLLTTAPFFQQFGLT